MIITDRHYEHSTVTALCQRVRLYGSSVVMLQCNAKKYANTSSVMPFLLPNQQCQITEGRKMGTTGMLTQVHIFPQASSVILIFVNCVTLTNAIIDLSALTLLLGRQEQHLACKKFE